MQISDLDELDKKCKEKNVPNLGPEKGTWLLNKVQEISEEKQSKRNKESREPLKILEFGTAYGYSTIILGSERIPGSKGAEVTTIDFSEPSIKEAKKNLMAFGTKAKIIFGDGVKIAEELVKTKKEYYDIIFIDFEKKSYLAVLENCLKMLKHDGWLIADNIKMKEARHFRKAVQDDKRLETEIIEIRDGMSCSRKR